MAEKLHVYIVFTMKLRVYIVFTVKLCVYNVFTVKLCVYIVFTSFTEGLIFKLKTRRGHLYKKLTIKQRDLWV